MIHTSRSCKHTIQNNFFIYFHNFYRHLSFYHFMTYNNCMITSPTVCWEPTYNVIVILLHGAGNRRSLSFISACQTVLQHAKQQKRLQWSANKPSHKKRKIKTIQQLRNVTIEKMKEWDLIIEPDCHRICFFTFMMFLFLDMIHFSILQTN